MNENSTIEIAGRIPLSEADGVFRRLIRYFVSLGPDLLLTIVMSMILAATVIMVGGHVRFFQASVGVPISIMVGLLIYRSILSRINPNFETNAGHILRDWLPFLLVTFIYENLHDLSGYFAAAGDIAGSLYKWDIAIFGVEPTLWAQKIFSPLLTDIMSISYAQWFIQPLILMLLLSNSDRRNQFRRMSLALTFSFLIGFAGYVIFPASPPRYFITELFTSPHRLYGLFLFDKLQGNWDSLSVVSCGAFPSLHVGLSSLALYYAWRYRKLSKIHNVIWWLYIPLVTSLWFSTVYLRHHWVVDIFAGWAVAALGIILSENILGYWQLLKKRYNLS